MKTKLMLACTAILVIIMIIVPVAAASPPTANPLDQILTIVKDIQIKVGNILTQQTLMQTDVTTIKGTTDTINTKLDALDTNTDPGIQMLTRTGSAILPIGTNPDPALFIARVHVENGEAADFKVSMFVLPHGDFTDEWGDHLRVGKGLLASNGGNIGTAALSIDDTDFDNIWTSFDTAFTGTYMSIYVETGEPLEKEVEILYSYTVTTDAGATITEETYPET